MDQYRTLHEGLGAFLRASLNTCRSENYFKQKFQKQTKTYALGQGYRNFAEI